MSWVKDQAAISENKESIVYRVSAIGRFWMLKEDAKYIGSKSKLWSIRTPYSMRKGSIYWQDSWQSWSR